MENLRWVLLILGIAILVAVYFFGRSERGRPREREARVAPVFGDEEPTAEVAPADPAPPLEPEKIVTLAIMARGDELMSGRQILEAVQKTGLELGDMGIFHRLVEAEGEKRKVFSLANLVAPGYFDLDQIHAFQTPGLSLFLALPGPESGLDAWDIMYATGERLAELLDADLMDENRSTLSRQTVALIRDELRVYDRQSLT